MPKVLRIHNSNRNTLKGVQPSDLITIQAFQGIADPLASGGTLINKPGSSIPSMFARMIFFRMSFASLDRIDVPSGQVAPVYNQIVSQCLDLLEDIYGGADLDVVVFDYAQQKEYLDESHPSLSEALNKQISKFLHAEENGRTVLDVPKTYLFIKNNKVIGGTSPYTLVYTAPNWEHTRPIKSLLGRSKKFREYLYKMLFAYQASQNVTTYNQTFFDYILECQQNDTEVNLNNLRGNYTLAQFNHDYPQFTHDDNGTKVPVMLSVTPELYLHTKNEEDFKSDFFLKSNVKNGVAFNPAKTPLVISRELHPGMNYYNGERWPSSLQLIETEDPQKPNDVTSRRLPGDNSIVKHPYVSAIDFFEDRLLAVPYPIDDDKFYGAVLKLDDTYSALLPFKSMCLKYLQIEDLISNLSVKRTDNSLILELKVAVCNETQQQTKSVMLKREYNLKTDVCYMTIQVLKTPFNVGIFPFYRSANDAMNKYWVMKAQGREAKYNTAIDFYKYGNSTPLYLGPDYPKARREKESEYYYVGTSFDFMQVKCVATADDHKNVNALIVPKFMTKQNTGNTQYHYSIDFGTTNTHIAYVGSDGKAECFRANEIFFQVGYLNKTQAIIDGTTKDYEDRLRVLKAREFYPQAKNNNDDTYSFPIRTVVGQPGAIDGNSEMFADVSIGFHFSKEILMEDWYKKSLKWDFLNTNSAEATNRGKLYFKQLLWMIKNHWIMRTDTDENDPNLLPKIMLTYPLNNDEPQVINAWKDCYKEIFGALQVVADANISKMTESLAPCRSLLQQTANAVNGLLNVDIGGGTTDLQYYRQRYPVECYFYDSIRYAGDDLWGTKYENMNIDGHGTIQNNAFTTFIDNNLGQCEFKIANEVKKLPDIKLIGKEKVNYLLRDQNNSLVNALSRPTPQTRIPRLIIFLHYSAIVYHVTNWIKCNPRKFMVAGKERNFMDIPETINFSGFGSKYIDIMFGDNAKLTLFTKALIKKFWPTAFFLPNFKVTFAANPKDVTCQGAALYAKHQSNGGVIPQPVSIWHFGYSDYASGHVVPYTQSLNKEDDVISYFKTFLEAYQSLNVAVDIPSLAGDSERIPRLNDAELSQLCDWATASFLTIGQAKAVKHAQDNASLCESMFVWALKDSIWRLS